MAREGAGAVTSALQIMSQSSAGRGIWAIVDPARECYVPALSGWGIDPSRLLVLRPATVPETCWAIEQCLRCPGVSATWAWVDRSDSRAGSSSLATGGGSRRRRGLVFSADPAQREPVWADLRLLVTPQAGGRGETRRVNIEVLYRRGGLGGSAQVVGDRPCRGSCASGSRSGRSSELRSARPELRPVGARALRRPESATFDYGLQLRKPNDWAFASGQPLAEAKALLPKAVFLPADVARGPECPLSTGARLPAILTSGRSGRGRSSRIAALRSHRLHTSLEWRGTISPGCSRLLARARLSHPTCAGFHDGGGLGARPYRDRRSCPQGMKRRLYRAFQWRRCGCRLRSWSLWSPWAFRRLATCCDSRARRWPAGLA